MSPRPARNLAFGALAGALLGQLLLAWRGRPRPARAGPTEATAAAPTAPVPEREPVPVAVPVSEPEPVPAGPFVEPRLGEWTLRDVELLLAEQGPAFRDRHDELSWYLASFRDVAQEGGRLPDGVEAIVEDVFAPLIERARATSAR